MTEALPKQARLAPEQLEAFYHEVFVDDQVRDFRSMVGDDGRELVVDIGGGCGFFAKRLADDGGYRTRVLDMDNRSVETCRSIGVESRIGDALDPVAEGDEDLVCFNLLLHHLVGKTDRETCALQLKALEAWHGKVKRVFVNEYIYESFVGNVSGRLIFEITSSGTLSAIARQLARVIPAFRANTFGVGVRFRSNGDWRRMFAKAGYRVVDSRVGEPEPILPPLRTLMIKTIRRDSFLLEPA